MGNSVAKLTRQEIQAFHAEALREFVAREFGLLAVFDQVVAAAGEWRARRITVENDDGVFETANIMHAPVVVKSDEGPSSLVFMATSRTANEHWRDGASLPGLLAVPGRNTLRD